MVSGEPYDYGDYARLAAAGERASLADSFTEAADADRLWAASTALPSHEQIMTMAHAAASAQSQLEYYAHMTEQMGLAAVAMDGFAGTFATQDELAQFCEPLPEPNPGDTAEERYYRAASRWETRCSQRQRWRVKWHGMSCVCRGCLDADFIVYIYEDIEQLEVRGL